MGTMTAVDATASEKKLKPTEVEDPEQYRMSIGDHLEELRWRLIMGLLGFVVAFAVCLFFGTKVVTLFVRPLYITLKAYDINPQVYASEVGSAFMVYMRISLISAGALAGPWLLYQFWLFVAAGLYKHERQWITKYLPLSITLLISGMAFVYFAVLPMTLSFFIGFNSWFPMPESQSPTVTVPASALVVPIIKGDPANPAEGSLWYNSEEKKIKFHLAKQTSVVQFLPQTLVAPHITLDDYVNLVMMMLLVFGLAFQLPLVVLALARIGIFEIQALRDARKMVYFVLLIVACVITPGDVITATIALLVPLILLYELGIFLAARAGKAPLPDVSEGE